MGQGSIVERPSERLGQSDAGIMLLRKIFWREMEAIRNGAPIKQWRRLADAEEIPVQGRPAAAAARS
jgi:5,5'-dehydrodivanillate O-demethylase